MQKYLTKFNLLAVIVSSQEKRFNYSNYVMTEIIEYIKVLTKHHPEMLSLLLDNQMIIIEHRTDILKMPSFNHVIKFPIDLLPTNN